MKTSRNWILVTLTGLLANGIGCAAPGSTSETLPQAPRSAAAGLALDCDTVAEVQSGFLEEHVHFRAFDSALQG